MDKPALITPDCAKDLKFLHDTLYVINGKWKMLVILTLNDGNARYRDIAKKIPGISFRMLSKELREMEMNNLVVRHPDINGGNAVHYGITAYCLTLVPLISDMIRWGKSHRLNISTC